MLAFVSLGILALALGFGRFVAAENYYPILVVLCASVAISVVLGFGPKIWVIIIFLYPVTGSIAFLPIPFSIRDMAVMAAFGTFLILVAVKKIPKMRRLNFCDWLMLINIGYLFTVYLRNPVGLSRFGSELVGGRPYFTIFLAVSAWWVLQHVTISPKFGFRLPLFMSLGSIFTSALSLLTLRFPSLVPYIAPFYSGISTQSYIAEATGRAQVESVRVSETGTAGAMWTRLVVSYYDTFQLAVFMRPLQSLLFYLAIFGLLLSGYRNFVIGTAVFILTVAYFRKGWAEIVKLCTLGLFAVLIIVILQVAGAPLPLGVQRSLSFIPAPWDEMVAEDAKGSSEWRFEMWKIALESDKYIKNKILGDGFGYSARDLSIQIDAILGIGGYEGGNIAEAQLVSGAYHSGPLSTIRYAGAVGLVFFLALQIAISFYAIRLIKAALGTPFEAAAFFTSAGAITGPIFFIFVFGSYDGGLPETIYSLAFMNLVHNGMQAYKAQAPKEVEELIAPIAKLPARAPAIRFR